MKPQPNISAADWRKDALKSKTEAIVQAEICQWLRLHGIPHTVSDATLSYNAKGQRVVRVSEGWPDITAVLRAHRGRMLAIECKHAAGGVLRYEQALTLSALESAGALVVIARSIDDVTAAIEAEAAPLATQREIAAAIAKGPNVKKRRAAKRIIAKTET